MFSPLEQFDANLVWECFFCVCLELSLFNIVFPLLIAVALFGYSVFYYEMESALVPTGEQVVCESLITFIFGVVKQQIGKDGYPFFPLIFILFNFILICNLFSLMPFGIALTSHIILTLWISLSLGLSIFILGLRQHNLLFLRVFIPSCPIELLPVLIIIELFSYVIRAFSLAIRLSANIMAGHTLIYIVSSFVVTMGQVHWIFFILSLNIVLAITVLEFGVAFLQAYVFTVLVCIYTNDSLKGATH